MTNRSWILVCWHDGGSSTYKPHSEALGYAMRIATGQLVAPVTAVYIAIMVDGCVWEWSR